MPLDNKDEPTPETELPRAAATVPLGKRFAALREAHPLPPRTRQVADKAFFDALSSDEPVQIGTERDAPLR